MKTTTRRFGSSQKVIALAILGAFGSVQAADEDIAQFTKPESSISVGATGVSGNSKDRSIFGQYNGMREHNAYLNLDIDYLKRDDATGTWMMLEGRNLGLDNRELSVSMQKQGDWKISGEASELVKRDIRTINTADTGVGSSHPTIVRLATPGTGRDVNLELKRVGLGLGVEKWITPSFQIQASFKNEDKDGQRFWGLGYDCASYVCAATGVQAKNVILMTAEPINFNTKQYELKFNFNDEKLNLSAGYYGSYFTNSNGSLNPTVPNVLNNGLGNAATLAPAVAAGIIAGGGTSLQNVLQHAMALPPANYANQFSLTGNYAFTPTTIGTFKYSFTRMTQDRSFNAMGLANAPVGSSNLDGKVDETLFQIGLTAKPIPKLSLLANFKYENKDDQTPVAEYNHEARTITPIPAAGPKISDTDGGPGVAATNWMNGHVSNTKWTGKLEASYMLPENIRATLGADYKRVERMVPNAVPASMNEEVLAGLGPLREKTEETGYRLELRRAISESLTGAVSYAQSNRKGSDWSSLSSLDPIQLNAVIADPLATAPNKATAASNLILVNTYCGGRACYGQKLSESAILGLSANTPFPKEMADTDRQKWKLSATWAPLENASLQFLVEHRQDENSSKKNSVAGGKGFREDTADFYSVDGDYAFNDNWRMTGYYSYGDQSQKINHSTGYKLDLTNRNDAFGLGLLGKVSSQLEIGANLTYLKDNNHYGIKASGSATGAPASANNLAQAAIGLPDVTFRQTTFSIFGKYAIEKNADVRVTLGYQDSKLDEWTWSNNGVPFTYADNTTVKLKNNQDVTWLGATYIYKFK